MLKAKLSTMIDVISECFDQEDGHNTSQLRQSRSFSESTTLPSELELSLDDWLEDDFPPLEPSGDVQVGSVALDRGRLFHRTEYLSVGLSTDCGLGFFLSKESVTVITLQNRSVVHQIDCKALQIKNLKDAQVALSRRFLAVILAETLRVLEYVLPQDHDRIRVEKFEYGWRPDCLAILETNERTWVSVGGRVYLEGVMHSSIKLYRVDRSGTTTLHLRLHLEGLGSAYLKLDFLKTLEFCPTGNRVACLTHNNRILTWNLSDELKPQSAPFTISRKYANV